MTSESAIAQELEHELRTPESSAEYADIIEALPELWRVLAERFPALAEDLSNRAGPAVESTVAALHDLATASQAGVEAAEQAALAFGEESSFWRGG
jgi:hypothetical protein